MDDKTPILEHLATELSTGRQSLLAVLDSLDEASLGLPTRNAGWTVRDVLAHTLASDADLIWMLESAAGLASSAARAHADHEREMASWAKADVIAIRRAASEYADRWRSLLAVLAPSSATTPVEIWWRSGRLCDVLGDYVGHDAEHAQDVRRALPPASL